jgi:ATP-dependent DNA helicase DinG
MPIRVRTAPQPSSSYTLPSPGDFAGLFPAKFTGWRGDQPRAILTTIDSDKRFIAQAAPTGFGKSLMYVAIAQLTGWRTCILTSTKGLQEQLLRDFNGDGVRRLVDIRGQNAYRCIAAKEFDFPEYTTCDIAPCHAGRRCAKQDGGCLYFDAQREAQSAQVVITNYAYWLSVNKYGRGLGEFQLLVLDEAHDAPDILAEFMSVELDPANFPVGMRLLDPGCDIAQWREWAIYHTEKLGAQLDACTQRMRQDACVQGDLLRQATQMKRTLGKLQDLALAQDDWIIEKVDKKPHGYKMRFDPIWPWKQSEELLFRDVPKVMLVSATLREKTAALLGIPEDNLDFQEYESSFPVERRPVIHVPTVQMSHRTTPEQKRTWLTRIDQIITPRIHQKGIIHTVSFARAKEIMENSEHCQHMILNETKNTKWCVERFKSSSAPCILVSPSITTGYDFPYDECRWQIIGKLPFPDNRAKVVKARMENDKQYSNYITMQILIQMCGRPMRADDDWAETFVIDDNLQWFMRNNKQFSPKWFRDALVWASYNPPPLQLTRPGK